MSGSGRRRRPEGESPEGSGQWNVPGPASGDPAATQGGSGRRRRAGGPDDPAAPYEPPRSYEPFEPAPGYETAAPYQPPPPPPSASFGPARYGVVEDTPSYQSPPTTRYGRPQQPTVVPGQVVPPRQPPSSGNTASGPARPSEDFSDLDIDFDEIVTDRPAAAPRTAPDEPAPASAPSGPSAPGGEPDPDFGTGDFAFAEQPDTASEDVLDWKIFADSRADLRGERIRKFRARAILLTVVVVLIAGGVGTYVYLTRTPGPARTAMLIQVNDATGNAVDSMLLVTDVAASAADGRASALLVPANLQYNDTGNGEVAFGGAEPSIPPGGPDALSSLLGIQVDGTWSVNEDTFGILVDDLGGVTVTTNAPITVAGKTLAAGQQVLSGAAVKEYAFTKAATETGAEQLARFQQVFTALLDALPAGSGTINSIFTSMNMLATDANFPNPRVATVLANTKSDASIKRLDYATLPVNSDGTLDATAAGPLVRNLLGGAIHAAQGSGGIARVLVEDGSGYTSADLSLMAGAQLKLINGGYTYIDGGILTGSAYPHTVVEVASSSGQNSANQVAETLGLPTTDVQVTASMPSLADVVVILGRDWPGIAGLSTAADPTGTTTTTRATKATTTKSAK